MKLDVRLPAGLMLTTIGVLLVFYGLFGDRAIYARSLGININLIWGLVVAAVGSSLILLARASARRSAAELSRKHTHARDGALR
jgi:hypothetical protein